MRSASTARAHAWQLAALLSLAPIAVADAQVALPSADATVDLLVVAPHPDDEVLMAAGVLRSAVAAGRRVAVVVVTNGDWDCLYDPFARQRETVAALALLGVPESSVHFLGYPDGHLSDLGALPLPPVPRRAPDGTCTRGNVTYGARGAGAVDEHTARTGAPAVYTAGALVDDLAAVLARRRPRDIYVAHAIDTHADHARAYAYLRRALDRQAARGATVTVHRALVHAGGCWPNAEPSTPGDACPLPALAPDAPLPALPGPYASYAPDERVAVPAEMRDPDPRANLKARAILTYASQPLGDPLHFYLIGFARSDEAFYTEALAPDPRAPGRLERASAASPAPSGVAWQLTGARPLPFAANVAQAAPARYAVTLDCAPGRAPALHFMERGAGADREAYVLRREGGVRLVLARERGASVTELGAFPLLGARGATLEVRVDPRPDNGGAAEISVRADGEFVGLAVDPAPIASGERVRLESQGACRFTAARVSAP